MTVAVLDAGSARSGPVAESDLVFETYRGSGPGGQHRNTSDTGVRVRHVPSGLVVKSDRARSWFRNRQLALTELERRLVEAAASDAASVANADRVAQIGVGDRAGHDWTWCAWRNTVTHSSGRRLNMDRALRGRVNW